MSYISAKVRKRVQQRAGNRCEYCLSRQDLVNSPFEIDHFIPVSRGGSDDEDNLCWACEMCNQFTAVSRRVFSAICLIPDSCFLLPDNKTLVFCGQESGIGNQESACSLNIHSETAVSGQELMPLIRKPVIVPRSSTHVWIAGAIILFGVQAVQRLLALQK